MRGSNQHNIPKQIYYININTLERQIWYGPYTRKPSKQLKKVPGNLITFKLDLNNNYIIQ